GGWYNHSLTISFSASDVVSGGVTCDASKSFGGPDTAGTTIAGGCVDAAGNRGTGSFSFRYDGTPPTVTAATARRPDRNGWYNAPVSVSFSGADALSGGVTCNAAKSYSGPDKSNANVTGSCSDAAGNSGTGAATFAYDATAPTASATARAADSNGW